MNLNISYADNEFLTGVVGYEAVTVGGMTVASQLIGLVTDAAWAGDGVNTGLLGLAYPALTAVYNGTDPNDDVPGDTVPYNPFFFTAVSENVVSNPCAFSVGSLRHLYYRVLVLSQVIFLLDFSIALNRGSFIQNDQNLGYLAFGGIAPVDTATPTITVPVQGYTVSTVSNKKFKFYTVDIDSYSDGLTSFMGSGTHAFLDSGSTLNYLPTDVAKAYNAKFVPPATFDQVHNNYVVDCDATVPTLEVEIGGSKFSIDGRDQILPVSTDIHGNKVCHSGTQDGGDPSDPGSYFVLCVPFSFTHSCFAVIIILEEMCSFITSSSHSTFSLTRLP